MIKSDSRSVVLNILFIYYHSICLPVVTPWSPQAILKYGPRVSGFNTLFTPRCIYFRLVRVGMFTLHSVFIQYDTFTRDVYFWSFQRILKIQRKSHTFYSCLLFQGVSLLVSNGRRIYITCHLTYLYYIESCVLYQQDTCR